MNIKIKEINPKVPDYIRGKPSGSYIRELISTLIAANRTDEKQSDEDIKKKGKYEWPFPPITVLKNQDPKNFIYTIIDGVHRLAAAKRLKLKEIPAKVLEGKISPAFIYVTQYTSQDQGLRLNTEQRNLAIKKMVKQYKMSTRDVGKAIGLHWTSIARIVSGKQAIVKGGETERKKPEQKKQTSKDNKIPDEIFQVEMFFERLQEIHELANDHRDKIETLFINSKAAANLLSDTIETLKYFQAQVK